MVGVAIVMAGRHGNEFCLFLAFLFSALFPSASRLPFFFLYVSFCSTTAALVLQLFSCTSKDFPFLFRSRKD